MLQNGNNDTSESKQIQGLQLKSMVGLSNIMLEQGTEVSQENFFL